MGGWGLRGYKWVGEESRGGGVKGSWGSREWVGIKG